MQSKGQRSLGLKINVETEGRMDGGDCITSRANAVRNNFNLDIGHAGLSCRSSGGNR